MLEITQHPPMTDEEKKAARREIKALQKELLSLQQPLKEARIPVLLLFEGPSTAGKGSMIAQVISELDPRGYQVYSYAAPTEQELRHPMLWPFWCHLPARGQMAVLDHGWYDRADRALRCGDDRSELVRSLNTFERQLADDGCLILKFWLNISRKEQKRRLEKLAGDPAEAWRATEDAWKQNRDWDAYLTRSEALLSATHSQHAPWHVVCTEDKTASRLEVLRLITAALRSAIDTGVPKALPEKREWPHVSMPALRQVDLSLSITDEEYSEALKKEKKKLQKLHSMLYRERIPVILGFEGWDAAGKGGAIRRLSWALDPRGFDVVPIAAPSPEALSRHYLWRFWKELPKDGHVALFDRTWYGRVMVERIEKLTPEQRWSAAYDEINEFEYELSRWGAIIQKFWLQIDSDTQLARFQLRQSTPEKQYKITDEDWRNRDKWPQYEQAVDEMLQKTSTEFAPWHIIEGNSKKYARIKVLRTVRKALEERLK